MKNKILSLFIGVSVFFVMQNTFSQNINFSQYFPNNSNIFQSQQNGWTNQVLGRKNIQTPEGCRTIISNGTIQYFIPTRTLNEWGSFKINHPNGIQITNCEIICENGFHKEGNSCVSNTRNCNIANGSGTQTWNISNNSWGNCIVKYCNNNFHKEENSCLSNTKTCMLMPHPGGGGSAITIRGTQTWNGTSWSTCIPDNCPNGTHKEGNSCVSNTKSCTIANGTGTQTWNGTAWGSCVATSCNSGYTKNGNNCVKNSIQIPTYPTCKYSGRLNINYKPPKTQAEKEEMIRRIIKLGENGPFKNTNTGHYITISISGTDAPNGEIFYIGSFTSGGHADDHIRALAPLIAVFHDYLCFWRTKLPEIANHPVSN